MITFLAFIIVRFLDPFSIIIAGVAGYFCGRLKLIFPIGILVALLSEILLHSTQITRTLDRSIFILIFTMPISIIHAFIGYKIAAYRSKKRSKTKE